MIAAVAIILRKRLSMRQLIRPRPVRGNNDKGMVPQEGALRFIIRKHPLMDLLSPWTKAHLDDIASYSECQIMESQTTELRDKDFSSIHVREGLENE